MNVSSKDLFRRVEGVNFEGVFRGGQCLFDLTIGLKIIRVCYVNSIHLLYWYYIQFYNVIIMFLHFFCKILIYIYILLKSNDLEFGEILWTVEMLAFIKAVLLYNLPSKSLPECNIINDLLFILIQWFISENIELMIYYWQCNDYFVMCIIYKRFMKITYH